MSEMTMKERVARALVTSVSGAHAADQYWPNWVTAAEAAIAAMGDPTPTMVEAGVIPEVVHGLTVSALYSDMVIAALSETVP